MAKVATCPELTHYQQLASGELPDSDKESLLLHLESCDSCARKLASLPHEDTWVERLLQAETDAEGQADEMVARLVEKLSKLRPGNLGADERTVPPQPIASVASLSFRCSNCQKSLKVKATLAGKKVKCPHCQASVQSPAAAGDPSEAGTLMPADSPTATPAEPVSLRDAPTRSAIQGQDEEPAAQQEVENNPDLIEFLGPAQAADELGRLGPYRILKVLGAGGMGVVYKAEDPELKRLVALKAMLPSMGASTSAKQRFKREAQSAAAIKHDHIVSIYQVGEENGVPFLAMEFLKGEPLDARLSGEQKLPVQDVLRIGREIAEGLAAAHEAGLMHRDIKPANVWLEASPGRKSGESRVKILDFGLARAADERQHLTQSGAIIGTPAYMAPEQAQGKKVDFRCDLFSLGCVLYRMCTGQAPFKGQDTISTLMAVATENPRPPSRIDKAVPEELSRLVMHLLAKDPAKRPASAAAVVEAIEAIEAVQSTTTKPAGPPVRRSRFRWAIVAGFLGGLFALLGGIYYIVTDNGTIEIRTEDENIQISLLKNGKEIEIFDPASNKTWAIRPGDYSVRLKGDPNGLEIVLPDTFEMKRGGKHVVTIRKIQGLIAAGPPTKQIKDDPAKPPPSPFPDAPAIALAFDGVTSYVEIPTLERNTPGVVTLEAWISNQLDKSSTGLLLRLYGKAPCHFSIARPSGVLAGREISLKGMNHDHTVFSDQPLKPNIWTHVSYVIDSNEVRLFLDGRLCARRAGPFFAELFDPVKEHGAGIGGAPLIPWRFKGLISGLRVSNSARYKKDFKPPLRFDKDSDTLALYRFDEGVGDELKDSSGNGHHGKIIAARWVKGDGTPIAPPAPRAALAFDGIASYVDIPTLARNEPGVITVEAWASMSPKAFLVVRVAGKAECRLIVWQQPAQGDGLFLASREEGPKSMRNVVSDQPLKLNTWIHVCQVIDKDEVRVFVDGKLSAWRAGPFFAELHDAATVGTSGIGGARNWKWRFQGQIAQVRISKSARYVKDFTPPLRFEKDNDTLAVYGFDEGSGDVLHDSSGNGHHGKIVGAKWVKAAGVPDAKKLPAFQPGPHSWPADAPPLAIAPFGAAQARKHQEAWAKYLKIPVEYKNTLGMKFMLIPPGEFLMGSPTKDPKVLGPLKLNSDYLALATPQRSVRITRPFYMQTHEVKNELYRKLVGKLPEGNDPANPDAPVMQNVTLVEATAFCDLLSRKEARSPAYRTADGKTTRILDANGYRLPTEAEWEYACRAGTTTFWYFGDEVDDNIMADHQTQYRGAAAKSNPFGLFDMYGGSSEWCFDRYAPYGADAVVDPFIEPGGTEGVARGGSFFANGGLDFALVNSVCRHPLPFFGFEKKWYGLGRVVLPIEKKMKSEFVSADPVRALAIQLLNRGAGLFLEIPKVGGRDAKSIAELPKEPFRIGRIAFQGDKAKEMGDNLFDLLDLTHGSGWLGIDSPTLTDAGLAKLVKVPGVGRINDLGLNSCAGVTDAGLGHVAKLTGVKQLSLTNMSLSGTGFAAFQENVQFLILMSCTPTPAGMAAIGKMPGLRDLNLTSAVTPKHLQGLAGSKLQSIFFPDHLTDEGLQHLAGIEGLKTLAVPNNQLTAKGLDHVKKMKKLEFLVIKGNPRLKKADVESFAKAMPKLKIESDFGVIGPNVTTATTISPKDIPIQLLPLLDLSRDVLTGAWKIDPDSSIRTLPEPRGGYHVRFPVTVKGDYRLKLEFTHLDGLEAVGMVLPVGSTEAEAIIGSHNNNRSGFGSIDGKRYDENQTTRRKMGFVKDKRNTVIIEVRADADNATVTAVWNGDKFVNWSGPIAKLSLPKGRAPTDRAFLELWLSDRCSNTQIHSATVEMLSGEAHLLRPR